MPPSIQMTINFFALFGENSSQTADTLTIDKTDLGLSPGANTAESILVALSLRLFRLGDDPILVRAFSPLVINGNPLIFPAVPLVINGGTLTLNGQPINLREQTAIEVIDILPIAIDGQPIELRNPEKYDLYCEISPAANIYQRRRLERSQKLVISQFLPYD